MSYEESLPLEQQHEQRPAPSSVARAAYTLLLFYVEECVLLAEWTLVFQLLYDEVLAGEPAANGSAVDASPASTRLAAIAESCLVQAAGYLAERLSPRDLVSVLPPAASASFFLPCVERSIALEAAKQ
jgi:hypothetical protein